MSARTCVIVLAVALVLGGSSWAYREWFGGWVIAHAEGEGRYSFKIRKVPLSPPGVNDGYVYRCEVWSGDVLVRASAYTEDSWIARRVSITPGQTQVVFQLDDYHITCRPPGDFGLVRIPSESVWSVERK